jgi:hypothetical protein
MSNDLEHRLHDHLHQAAGTAPAPMLQLTEIDARVAQRRRRRTAVRGVMAVGVVVGLGAAVMAMRDPQSTGPAGPTETPLTRLPDATIRSGQPTKPGAVALELADGQRITFAIIGNAFYDGYAQETWVQYDTYSTGFAYADDVDLPLVPRSELGGTESLIFWTGLPASATRVEYLPVTGESLWQTPVDGFAAFPAAAHAPDDTLVAYDVAGSEVARTTWSTTHLLSSNQGDDGILHDNYTSLAELTVDVYGPIDVTKIADLDRAATEAYTGFADATMLSCLSTNGDAAWTECIQSTDAAVKEYLG